MLVRTVLPPSRAGEGRCSCVGVRATVSWRSSAGNTSWLWCCCRFVGAGATAETQWLAARLSDPLAWLGS
jgi:hypothetical protein